MNQRITVSKTTASRLDTVDFNRLGFGLQFSDHMFQMVYEDGRWHSPEIIPYQPIPHEPANTTLHYGQTVFEGLKAFYAKNGVNVFRPDKHAVRLLNSCERMCIPTFEKEYFTEAIDLLVQIDYDWIPRQRGHALYIRPLIYSIGNFLGVKESDSYRFLIMTSPVASYYEEGLSPVKILATDKYVRAVKGGTGSAKTAGNYAASLYAAREAKKMGFTQVLWLDAIHHEYVEEVGTMNIFFLIDDELITPPLSGTILPGVTRDSVLTLAREWGMNVSEREISIKEVIAAAKKGTLREMFGTGTSAVISPVGKLRYKDDEVIINDFKIGPVAQKFYDEITAIQYGEKEDTHGWIHHVEIASEVLA